MKSTWTLLLGFMAVAAAAFWYDARNADAHAASPDAPSTALISSAR